MRIPARLPLVAGATAALLLGPCLAGVAPAGATTPSVPSGMRVAAVTSSSFTVSLPAVRGATSYRVLASTTKSDVWVNNYGHPSAQRRTASATHPSITVSRLSYTTSPYWFRVIAVNGGSIRWATTYSSVGLRPSAPTSVSASSGSYLTWSAGAATGSRVEQASNSAFTSGVHTYAIRGTTHVFTPYGLTTGRAYWFRVRSTNASTSSSVSPAVKLTPARAQTSLRVLTYNLLALRYDGTTENGQKISAWSSRRIGAAKLITQAAPAVVAVQEAYDTISASKRPSSQPCTRDRYSYHYRNKYDAVHEYLQVDSLCDALGDHFRRANNSTDATAGSDHGKVHAGMGNYLLYNPSKASPVSGATGFFNLGPGAIGATNQRTAAFTVFTVVGSRARVLVTSAHPVAPAGASYDRIRATQTASLISQAKAAARAYGAGSIVYAGDFNAYAGRKGASDTPGSAMRAAGSADALQAAQSVHNSTYNSVNGYERTPPQHGGCVDHVYVTGGVGVRSWNQSLSLSKGRFVGTIPSDHNPVYVDLALPV